MYHISNYYNVNYFLTNSQLSFLLFYLYKLLLNNTFHKKLVYTIIKKPIRHRYIYLSKNPKIYKVKFNFFLKKKAFFFKKSKLINKIIKVKKLTGLFKRKVNLRITILKKRSFLFKRFNKPNQFNKFKFFRKRRYWDSSKYRVYNVNFHKRRKLMFFENRKIIRLFLKKRIIKKQNKLSVYLVNLLGKNSKNLLNFFEYKLAVVLIRAHFFNNLNDAFFFIKKGFVSVNGKINFNPDYLVKLSDIIKINDKYYFYKFYRNSLNSSIFASKKINWAFYKFRKRVKNNKFFPKVYKWIISNRYFGFDVPYYFEVDYINLILFILMKPFDVNNIDYVNIKYINFYLTRLYNWNYIV